MTACDKCGEVVDVPEHEAPGKPCGRDLTEEFGEQAGRCTGIARATDE